MNGLSRIEVPVKERQQLPSVRRKTGKRKAVVTAGAVALALLISVISGAAGKISDKVVFYVRVMGLYTEAPDTTIAMPLPEIEKRQIANTWHAPRGTDRLHEGQDIFASKGTPIYSATRGYVYKIGENNLGGQTISVIGAGGRIYYYAHLDSYAPHLAVGDSVTTQTVLGFVGTTGNAQGTPPHLHFGVYTASGPIDPLPLLTDRPATATAKSKTPKAKGKRIVVNRKA
jgi:murein DD-endopeptidase MepM/ murein hydrolase activator NlpD